MKLKNFTLSLLLMATLWGLGGCEKAENASPKAWFDYPAQGDHLRAGKPVLIVAHAYAPAGVNEMMLTVNGQVMRRDAFVNSGNDFSEIRQEWMPTEAGEYVLQVIPYDVHGHSGIPDTITIIVDGATSEATATTTPTLPPTSTDTPPPTSTITATPTPSPTLTPTMTAPPSPTYTPTPTHTPPPTPADTSPPPTPEPVVPADNLTLSCRDKQTLVWMPVSDPSGIAGYYVTLAWEVKAGQWEHIQTWGPIQDKQLEITVDCGIRYRWQVRAQDNAGNMSDWSQPFHFIITLD